MRRRLVLQMAGLACAVSPCDLLLANTKAHADLKFLVVRDDQAQPLFAAGDLLLTDIRQMRFTDNGIYLYPNWGAPRPYMVNLVECAGQAQMLEFRNPGSRQLLWTQSAALNEQFAGRLVEHFPNTSARNQAGNYSLLRLPALPVTTKTPLIIDNISGTV